MKRARMVGLVCSTLLVTAIGLGPMPAASARSGADDRAEIRRVIEVVGDVEQPVSRRAAVLEDGDELRGVLRELSRPGTATAGVPLKDMGLAAAFVRVYGDRADVRFSATAGDMSFATGVTFRGLALRDHRRWVLAQASFCQVTELVGVGCPGPQRHYPLYERLPVSPVVEGATVVPVVFPEGTRAEVVLPRGVPDDGWSVRPMAQLRLGEKRIYVEFSHGRFRPQQVLTHLRGPDGSRVPLDVEHGLVTRIGSWTAMVQPEGLTDEEVRVVARSLRGTELDGFPVLEPSAPLTFFGIGAAARPAKTALSTDPAALPLELVHSVGESYDALAITLGRCDPAWFRQPQPVVHADYFYGERCADGAIVGVEGTDADLLRRLWEGVEVRDVVPSVLPVES